MEENDDIFEDTIYADFELHSTLSSDEEYTVLRKPKFPEFCEEELSNPNFKIGIKFRPIE